MEYVTIHTTTDKAEISSLKALFESKGIHYRVIEEEREALAERDQPEQRLQVREGDREKARKVLHDAGYLRIEHPSYVETERKKPVKRWMFLFLAALVLLIVILLIAWFMNPDLH